MNGNFQRFLQQPVDGWSEESVKCLIELGVFAPVDIAELEENYMFNTVGTYKHLIHIPFFCMIPVNRSYFKSFVFVGDEHEIQIKML